MKFKLLNKLHGNLSSCYDDKINTKLIFVLDYILSIDLDREFSNLTDSIEINDGN